jgi:chromosome segregation ATPase
MASIQARIAESTQKETDAQKELERLVQDQERFRQNLQVLRENPKELELRARYLKRLEGVDRAVDTLRATIDSSRTERQGLEAELRRVVNAFREG